MVRLRDKNKKSTGGRPPRKQLAAGVRRSVIQRPSRHDLYIMKRREAYLLAAKEALEQEDINTAQKAQSSNPVLDEKKLTSAKKLDLYSCSRTHN